MDRNVLLALAAAQAGGRRRGARGRRPDARRRALRHRHRRLPHDDGAARHPARPRLGAGRALVPAAVPAGRRERRDRHPARPARPQPRAHLGLLDGRARGHGGRRADPPRRRRRGARRRRRGLHPPAHHRGLHDHEGPRRAAPRRGARDGLAPVRRHARRVRLRRGRDRARDRVGRARRAPRRPHPRRGRLGRQHERRLPRRHAPSRLAGRRHDDAPRAREGRHRPVRDRLHQPARHLDAAGRRGRDEGHQGGLRRPRAASSCVSSTKSATGHQFGGAGSFEVAVCALALRDQIVPPTLNYRDPDPECDLDYVPEGARKVELEYALSNSMGLGGHNGCVVLRRYSG